MQLTIKVRPLLSYNQTTEVTEIRLMYRAIIGRLVFRQVSGVLGASRDTNKDPKVFIDDADAMAYFDPIVGPEIFDAANATWPEPFFTSYKIVTE